MAIDAALAEAALAAARALGRPLVVQDGRLLAVPLERIPAASGRPPRPASVEEVISVPILR